MASTASQSSAAPRGPRWANRLAVVGFALLAIGPLGFAGTKGEIAAWHAAAGQAASWRGNAPTAVAKFSDALAWDPNEPTLLALRAEELMALGKLEDAHVDAARAREIDPANARAENAYHNAMVRLGRSEEIARLWETRLEEHRRATYNDWDYVWQRVPDVAMLHNNIAYHLAMAGKDLDRALEHAELAMKEDTKHSDEWVYLDTRGYVRYRLGKHEEALADLQRAVGLATSKRFASEAQAKNFAVDERHLQQQLRPVRRGLAAAYYHRALVLDAMGRVHEAVADRAKVRELGCLPDETLF